MTVVERFKQKSMYGLSTKKSGRCREVAFSGGSTVLLIFVLKAHVFFERKYILIIVQSDLLFSLFAYKNFADSIHQDLASLFYTLALAIYLKFSYLARKLREWR